MSATNGKTSPKALNERLRMARKARGLNQSELAERIGLSMNSVSEWERGVREPKLPGLLALADGLGLTLDELVRGDLATALARSRVPEPPVLDAAQVERLRQVLEGAQASLRAALRQAAQDGSEQFDPLVDSLSAVREAQRVTEEGS